MEFKISNHVEKRLKDYANIFIESVQEDLSELPTGDAYNILLYLSDRFKVLAKDYERDILEILKNVDLYTL